MKFKKLLTSVLCCVLVGGSATTSYAHSGRTDAYGGHHDYKNVSGLGSYHYHHGYPAHLHPNGVCPYASTNTSTSSSSSSSSKSSVTTTPKATPAPKPQPKVEKTEPTDILAFLHGWIIPATTYKGSLYVVAEDLTHYGYDVMWDSSARELHIKRNYSKQLNTNGDNPTTSSVIQPTDIKTYVCRIYDTESYYTVAESYNIGGKTIIKFSDLGDSEWVPDLRVSIID